jgi:pyruvate dehydrogenase E1 component
MTPELEQDILAGAYWHRKPGANCEIVIAYAGTVAPEAIEAVGLMGEDRRDIGLLAVTSADRLLAGWAGAQRAREQGLTGAQSHIERLFLWLPPHTALITVVDGFRTTLSWLGAVCGHRTRAMGVDHFGQTGTMADLFGHYGIDAHGIARAADTVTPGRSIRHLRLAR